MRSRRRVGDHAASVANVGRNGDQLERIDHRPSTLTAATYFETQHATVAGLLTAYQRVLIMVIEARVEHTPDLGLGTNPVGELQGLLTDGVNTQFKQFEALV